MALASRLRSIEDAFNGLLVLGSGPAVNMIISIVLGPYMVVSLVAFHPCRRIVLVMESFVHCVMHGCISTWFIVLATASSL